ncbi:arylsulfatase [Streptomyces abyssalis]|uniref:Arylsulfatase n=1 Tax=Streptomyces abyssalis TaxID=933944 RepID=A0A1E7JSW6_9ACTN|nr:sulfatase-like hydrolase/transferase [Streptomyces abyssalis]OEU91989.1 arylsulfatase [Streptomyces abyssalis]OEU93869.1 arylsulfatase [Streptomyces abyssalis]
MNTEAPREHPNVLVFFTDQQRWDTTGLHGNPLGLTPTLDGLARRGVSVDHSYTCQPVCAPSRASLQTGQYPTTTGVFRNGIPLPPGIPTLAHHFRAAGYETGYIGKWHLAPDEHTGPVPERHRGGYDHWLAANLLEFTSDAYSTSLYDGDGRPRHFDGYRADALGTAAVEFLQQQRTGPFFLFLSFLEPHHQNSRDDYPAPDGYRERYADAWTPADLRALGGGNSGEHLAGYYGMVRRLDEVLGTVLDALARRDELENTVVLFTSDHGCHFKTRNDEYKRSLHDASIRVPTVLCGPGLRGGRRLGQLVSHVDLPPTLLDAAGVDVPDGMQGRSLLPLLRDEAAGWPEEVLIQISESEVGRAVRTHRWKYGVSAPDADAWQVPSADRYLETYLYDLHADPDELVNRVSDPECASVRQALGERLAERVAQSGEPRPVIDPPLSPGQPQ